MQSGIIERGFKGVLWVMDSILPVFVSFSLAFSKVTGSVAHNMGNRLSFKKCYLTFGVALHRDSRSCLASGKVKDFFQNSRPGYWVQSWECSLVLLDKLKSGLVGNGQNFPWVP